MRILVTGGTGFIGGNVIKSLRQLNKHEIILYRRGDDINSILKVHSPELIINCAADIYNKDFKKMLDINYQLPVTIAEWAVSNNSRFIHFGSSSEYGPVDGISTEKCPLIASDNYGKSKAMASEHLLCMEGLNCTILRPYSPFGPGESTHRLFPKLWRAAKLNEEMTLVNGIHDFTYINDLIRALRIVIEFNYTEREDYNICSSQPFTNFDVLEMFEEITGKKLPVTKKLEWSTPDNWRGSYDKIRNVYGWQPIVPIEHGIALFLRDADYE